MSSIKIKQENEKEIIALTQFEAVRHRPGMYVGSILPNEEKIPLIIDNKLISSEVNWSMGLMQTFIEIFENGLDEAKRCKGTMKNIHVVLDLDSNKVTVRDEGNGFYRAHEIHSKTKKTVVRTALEELHAGSNFSENNSNILGTHGVGASCVNVLSEYFEVSTTNETHKVDYVWNDFKVVKQRIQEIEKVKNPVRGTSISFIPSKEVFNNQKWDTDIILTYLSFKQMLIKNDPVINELVINATYIKGG
ncbi:MAG: ATP-binding protein, partial [Clostridia bacterium]